MITETVILLVEDLIKNELILGRLASFLSWFELYNILANTSFEFKNNYEEQVRLFDNILAVRILHENFENINLLLLSDILKKYGLFSTKLSVLYLIGNFEGLKQEFKNSELENTDRNEIFSKIYNQPFKYQILQKTNFQNDDKLILQTKILGSSLIIRSNYNVINNFLSETILAYFESYFATSTEDIFPIFEEIIIEIIDSVNATNLNFNDKILNNNFVLTYNSSLFSATYLNDASFWVKTVSKALTSCFRVKDLDSYLEKIFKKEETHERQTFVLNHYNRTIDVLGKNPKISLKNWIDSSMSEYQLLRTENLIFKTDVQEVKQNEVEKLANKPHTKSKIYSIIDPELWNDNWKAFGFISYNNISYGIILLFENIEKGELIFNDWIKRIGK